MVRDVAWIDKKLPSAKMAAGMLTPSRVEHTAIWLGAETAETGRVAYGEGTLTQVAPTVFGVYPEETGVHSVPVDVTPDGKVSRIYPPTYLEPGIPVIGVGDAGELLLEVPANRELLDAHEEHLTEISETITQIDEHNRDVVDPFIRDTDHALTVDLPAAKQVAQDAQAKAIEALTQGNKGVADAAEAKAVAEQAKADAAEAEANLLELAGKTGRVIRSKDAPTGDDRNSNNLWFNTNLNMLFQWTGSKWEQIKDPEVTIAAIEAQTAHNAALEAVEKAKAAQATADNALYIGNMAAELAAGMVWVDETEPPFDSRVDGQVWIKINADGQMEGVYRLRDASTAIAQWDTYTVLTGLLIVPGENGTPTIIDQNGLTVGQIEADAITTGVLAAGSVGAKQLIIGEITRAHLDAGVDGVLADAEEIASRVVIDPSSITISRSVVGSQGKLTALRLEATKMDFIVDGKSVAYIDSNKNLMSIGNAYVRDALQIGEHQVRRLGQGGITVFQYVGV